MFAPGFSYEKSSSRENFMLNENKLWFGDNFVKLFDGKVNKWHIEVNKGHGWDLFYDEGMGCEVAT